MSLIDIVPSRKTPEYRLSSTREVIIFRIKKGSSPFITFEEVYAGCYLVNPVARQEGLYSLSIASLAREPKGIVEGNNLLDIYLGSNETDRLQLGILNFVIKP